MNPLLVIELAAGSGVVYLFSLLAWPFLSCRWCDNGKRRGPGRRLHGLCRWCGGSGRKVRLGARLLARARGK